MRFVLAMALICGSAIVAKGEEAYLSTQGQLGTCLGGEVRSVVVSKIKISAEALDAMLKEKCGFLEDRAISEFSDFVFRQLSRTLSEKEQAALGLKIMLEIDFSPHEMRHKVVEVYSSAILNHK